jgi:hypothetical protein
MATSMNRIVGARFLIVFASGFATMVMPIFLGELSPPSQRYPRDGDAIRYREISVTTFGAFLLANLGMHRRAVFGTNIRLAEEILI